MLHPLRPGHLAYVNETFNSLLQLHESAVIGNAEYATLHMRADRITFCRVEPGIGRELLKAKRDSLLVLVELEHLHVDFIAHIYQVARMRQASPGHVSDVQQAIESAEIDKRAVIGEVLHRSGKDRTLFEVIEGLGALLPAPLPATACARPRCCRVSCSA